jgi:Flp pilus assembly protein TadG
MARTWRRLAKDTKGNVVVLFAFSIIPILLGIGVAVDFGRALLVHERMHNALDAAALAIGSWSGLSQDQLAAKAQQFFDANFSAADLGAVGKISVGFSVGDIKLAVSGTMPTTFMKLANINSVDVGASTVVRKKERKIELVLVLDTTGSMAFSLGSTSKISALKSAAKKMVSTLFEGSSTSSDVKVGVVPFAAAVNVGSDKMNSGWLDTKTYSASNASADPIPFEDLDKTTGISPLNLYSSSSMGLSNRKWGGCVRERGAPYTLTDDSPDSAMPKTLWAPYFAPDEPDSSWSSYANNYLSDDSYAAATCVNGSGTNDQRQCYTGKYQGKSVYGTSKGPDFNCPPTAILAMTSSRSDIDDAIDALTPKGSTVIPAGLLWGWRVISPAPPFTEGASYGDDKYVKAIVLLTDGENDVGGGRNGFDESYYNAFGYAKNGHLGSTSGSDVEATLDSYTTTVCNNIKAQGIEVYTIGLGVTSASQSLLQSCATKPSMFYNSPSSDQLASIFGDIAKGLSDLRVAQ